MDENKINPTPMDDPEEQKVDIEVPMAEPVEEPVVEEQTQAVDNEAEAVIVEEDEADNVNDNLTETVDEQIDDDGMVDSFEEEPVSETAVDENLGKKKKSKGAVAVLVILVALLVATSVFLVSMIVSKTSSSKIDFDEIAVTVGDVDITVGEYMYWYAYVDAYYYNYYSYYYSSISEDQIKADTLNQLTFTSSLYSEAVKAGYTLSAEESTQIDNSMQSYTEAAEAASMDVDEYIAGNFGKGYTAEMLRTYLEKQAIAYSYYEDMMAQIDSQYEGDGVVDKIETAYQANKLTYDLSDVLYFYFDATDDSAEKNANSLMTKVSNDGMTFDAAIKSVTGDSASVANELVGYDCETLSDNFSEDAATWIFETDADGNYVNGAGSVNKLESGGMIYVLYVNEAPHRDECVPVTLDYIQVDVSTDDSVKSADELDIQAKATANSILAEFEETDKTAEAFAHLVLEYSEGDDVLVSGDAYEDMVADGSYDSAVEDWAFAAERSVGDYAVIKGDGCYFVVFYREKAENSVWYQSVLTSLVQAEKTSWESELLAEYESAVVSNDEVVDNAVAFIKANLES